MVVAVLLHRLDKGVGGGRQQRGNLQRRAGQVFATTLGSKDCKGQENTLTTIAKVPAHTVATPASTSTSLQKRRGKARGLLTGRRCCSYFNEITMAPAAPESHQLPVWSLGLPGLVGVEQVLCWAPAQGQTCTCLRGPPPTQRWPGLSSAKQCCSCVRHATDLQGVCGRHPAPVALQSSKGRLIAWCRAPLCSIRHDCRADHCCLPAGVHWLDIWDTTSPRSCPWRSVFRQVLPGGAVQALANASHQAPACCLNLLVHCLSVA